MPALVTTIVWGPPFIFGAEESFPDWFFAMETPGDMLDDVFFSGGGPAVIGNIQYSR